MQKSRVFLAWGRPRITQCKGLPSSAPKVRVDRRQTARRLGAKKRQSVRSSVARRGQTTRTIRLKFSQLVRTAWEKLRPKAEPPVRIGTPRRRPLPVWSKSSADAERSRTAPSFLQRSFPNACLTSTQNFNSIVARVQQLQALELRVDTPLV